MLEDDLLHYEYCFANDHNDDPGEHWLQPPAYADLDYLLEEETTPLYCLTVIPKNPEDAKLLPIDEKTGKPITRSYFLDPTVAEAEVASYFIPLKAWRIVNIHDGRVYSYYFEGENPASPAYR